jgi:hypothetical protein
LSCADENKHISDSLYRQIADRLGSLTAPPLSGEHSSIQIEKRHACPTPQLMLNLLILAPPCLAEAQRAEMVQIFQQHVAAAATPAEAPPASDDAQVLQALANLQQQMQQQMQQGQQQMQQMQQDVNLLINRLP